MFFLEIVNTVRKHRSNIRMYITAVKHHFSGNIFLVQCNHNKEI